MQPMCANEHQQNFYNKKRHMRHGITKNQMSLTCENSVHRFGYCYRVRKNNEKSYPSLNVTYLWDSMMDLNPLSTTMPKRAMYLPHGISASSQIFLLKNQHQNP